MKWLLWRECRLNLAILGFAAFLLVVPYLVALTVFWLVEPNLHGPISPWVSALGGAACYSVILNQLTLALLGGNAFAGERSDGSAEFMAYQPVSRARRIASKLLLVLIAGIVVWGLNAAVMAPLYPHLDHRFFGDAIWTCLLIAITGLAFYCIAWLVSAIQSSTTFAVAAGLTAPFLLLTTLQLIAWWLGWRLVDQRDVVLGYGIGCVLMALVSFPIGTWYYLRRIEP